MLIPVRCFTCGKVIADKVSQFQTLSDAGMPINAIYKEIGIKKICCKRMFLTYVNVGDELAVYDTLPERVERTKSVDEDRHYRAI